jgi:hypothetical protein
MITVQLSFTVVVPTNCEPVVTKLVECIANILTSSNLTASLTTVIKLVSSLQASSSLSASVLVSKLAQSNLNTESSLAANIQIAKLASSSLNAGSTLSADALVTRLFEASLNGNGSLFANPLITKFAASSLNANASLNASALVSKLAASSLTGAGTLAADLTVTASATLLLDLYPNAAAAYSLRKLRNAYAGSAIRVRRSSDNTEQDIGFVSGNLDTVALLAFCGVGNGFVTTWYDQSGNAMNATQATAANQLDIVSNGVVILQGAKPCLRNTTNTFKNLSASFGVTVTNPQTFLISNITAFDPNNGGYSGHWLDFGNAAANNHFIMPISDPGSFNDSFSSIRRKFGTFVANYNQNYLECYENISTITTRFLNNIDRGNNTFTVATTTVLTIGGLSTTLARAIGTCQEIIIYANGNSSNRTAISDNINSHYAIY